MAARPSEIDNPQGGPADQLMALADVDLLLPYQQQLLGTVAENALIVVEKSRRIGYTWAAAAAAVLTAATEKADGGMDALYLGPSLDMAREFIDVCGQWARLFDKACSASEETEVFFEGDDRAIKAFRIAFASGQEIIALTSRPRSLRGRQGLVILDEAAFQDDLEEVLKAALALLIWGGRVLVISTHDGNENPFNKLVEDIRAKKKKGVVLRVTLQDALADGLYRRICLVTGRPWSADAERAWLQDLRDTYGDGAKEELDCEPRASGGAYLPRALIEARMDPEIPVLRWSCKAEFVHLPDHIRQAEARDWCEANLGPVLAALDPTRPGYYGQDFGRHGDLTVMAPLQLMTDLTRRPPCVVELRNVPFLEQEAVAFYLLDRLPLFTRACVDAGGNGMQLAERLMQRYGAWRVEQVKFSTEIWRQASPPYKAALEGASILLPKDADIRIDHQAVVMEGGVAKVPDNARSLGADGGKRHGDSYPAFVLAWRASESDGPPPAGETVPPPNRQSSATVRAGWEGTAEEAALYDALRVVAAEVASDPRLHGCFSPHVLHQLDAMDRSAFVGDPTQLAVWILNALRRHPVLLGAALDRRTIDALRGGDL